MTAILRDLKRFFVNSKNVELSRLIAAFERPGFLAKRGAWLKAKLSFCWRGCQCNVPVQNAPQEGLRRTMYWRGCRYDVVIPSLDPKKVTVIERVPDGR